MMGDRTATIRVHRSFAAAEADWRAAEGALVHYGFQRFDWLAAWQETLGAATGVVPAIVVVARADGAPAMLLPFGITRWQGLRALVFLGTPVTDYRGPMIARDFDMAGFPALWARILAALPRVDVVRLDRVPEAVEGVANPMTALAGARTSEQAWSMALPASEAAFRAGRSTKFNSDSRRRRRRLAEMGDVRLEVAADDAAMSRVLALMKAEKTRRWLETGNPDGFAQPGFAAFYDLATARLPGVAHGSLLWCGDVPVAAHWGIVHGGRFYFLMIASRAGEWARFSAGRLLTEDLVLQSIAGGLTTFDLTAGDEGYKKDWADRVMVLWEMRQGTSLAGRAALGAEAGWAALRARAKGFEPLRRAVRRLRGGRAARPDAGPDAGPNAGRGADR